MSEATYSPGLEGVVAGETAISTVTGGLRYCGYPLVQLAETCSFEEVAWLLLHGELPNGAQLQGFRRQLAVAMALPPLVSEYLRKVPRGAVPMDVVRTAVSMLAHFEAELDDNSREANLRKAERLLAQVPVILGEYWRASQGLPMVPVRPELGHAEQMLYLIKGEVPDPVDARAFDVSLILYAEHEYNASTFTARVVCSTEADLHSGVVGAIGALKGPLHGGANEKVMDLLAATGGPRSAAQWVQGALARKEKIMGFGHRVYKTGDVRAGILKEYARQAAERSGSLQWEHTAAIVEEILAKEKNLFPNLDWPAGRLYHALGLAVPLYTPFFVASRMAGWCAHIIEQQSKNRIIRPRANYIGHEERRVPPLGER